MEPADRVFENTFAKACTNRTLTVGAIIVGLGHGAFKYAKLPQEVRDAVDAEMERRRRLAARGPTWRPKPDETWKLDILDAGLLPKQNPASARRMSLVLEIKQQNAIQAVPISLAEKILEEDSLDHSPKVIASAP